VADSDLLKRPFLIVIAFRDKRRRMRLADARNRAPDFSNDVTHSQASCAEKKET